MPMPDVQMHDDLVMGTTGPWDQRPGDHRIIRPEEHRTTRPEDQATKGLQDQKNMRPKNDQD